MTEFTEVKTSVGIARGGIVLMWDEPLDTIAYDLEGAEKLANKILELVEQARESLTKS